MEIKIINHIEIAGETYDVESLSEEKMKQVREILQERIMVPAGYKRKTA